MASFGRRGVSYTPFFAQSMGGIVDAVQSRRDRAAQRRENELAQAAYMGDPEALQNLVAVNPELARETEKQAQQRQKIERQTETEKDASFQEDTQRIMEEIAQFPDYASAADYGQRMTDYLMQKYPERSQARGAPPEFTEQVFNEMKTIGARLSPGAKRGPVGGAGYWRTTVDAPGMPKGTVLRGFQNPDGSSTVTDPVTNAPMTVERMNELGVRATGSLDAQQAGAVAGARAYGAGVGEAEATVETAADVAEAEAQAAAAAEAQVDLPQMADQTARTINIMNEIRNDPALETVTGLSSWIDLRNAVPGTEAYDLKQKIDQVQGEVFRQAFQSLKGGGQITEFESQAAGKAIARLENAQSKEAFLEALDDFEDAMRSGFAKLERQAAGDFTYQPLPERMGGGGGAATEFTQQNPASPASKADYDALPSGSYYTAPDGSLKRKR